MKGMRETPSFVEIIRAWSKSQGFTTWAEDHSAVLRNMAAWMDKNATNFKTQDSEEALGKINVILWETFFVKGRDFGMPEGEQIARILDEYWGKKTSASHMEPRP